MAPSTSASSAPASSVLSTTPIASTPGRLSSGLVVPLMLHGIRSREVIAKVDSFIVLNLHFLGLLIPLFTPETIAFVVSSSIESKQGVGVDLVRVSLCVSNVHVCLHLILSSKSHVALRLANLIWTQVVGL